MIVEDGRLRVLQGPRENLHRPAIDPLSDRQQRPTVRG
jgi:hypothetical protein